MSDNTQNRGELQAHRFLLTPVEPNLDFGTVSPKEPISPKTFLIQAVPNTEGRITTDVDWIAIEPITFGAGQTKVTIRLRRDRLQRELQPQATITVTISKPIRKQQQIPVRVEVQRYSAQEIDAMQAELERLQSLVEAQQVPELQVNPTSIDFGEVQTGSPMPSETVDVRNVGSGELQWYTETEASWLRLTEERDQLIIQLMADAGTHQGTIKIESNGGTATLSIKADVIAVPSEQLSWLFLGLQSDTVEVRVSAAKALGKFGDKNAVDALVNALKDKDKEVLECVVRALGQLDAVESLINALEGQNKNVRCYAARTLGELGDQRAVELLLNMLSDKDQDAREHAAKALGQLGAVESLINALKENNGSVSTAAAHALGQLGDARAVDSLINALKYGNTNVRIHAADALGQLGDKRAIEPLVKALNDGNTTVCAHAAIVLGQLGDKRAAQPLVQLFKDGKSEAHEQVAKVLISIGESAVEPLINALKDNNIQVRARTVEFLEQFGDRRTTQPLLIQSIKDESKAVRELATKVLLSLGGSAVEPLILALKDNDTKVRARAVVVLGQLSDKRAVEPLIAALLDESAQVRTRAATALGRLGDPRAAQPLTSARKGETSYTVKDAIDRAKNQIQGGTGRSKRGGGRY